MPKRPSIKESLALLTKYAEFDSDVANVLAEYERLVADNQEFLASRLVVEIVHNFNLKEHNAKETAAS